MCGAVPHWLEGTVPRFVAKLYATRERLLITASKHSRGTLKLFSPPINGGSPQIGRERDDATGGPQHSAVAPARDWYRTMGNVDVYTEFELLQVKVHIGVLGTVGFSPPSGGMLYV